MPIQSKWRKFTRETLETLPEKEGAYELANSAKHVIYNGSSNNLRRRLITHLINGKFTTVRYFRCEVCAFWSTESGRGKEAKHAQKIKDKTGRKPKYVKRSPHVKNPFGF